MSTALCTPVSGEISRWPIDRDFELDQGFWRLAYTKPRNEKALAKECQARDVGFYLPLYTKRTRRPDNGKQRKSILPLFAGYFPFVDRDNARLRLLESNRVVSILDIPDQYRFVRDLTQIYQAVQSGAGLEPIPRFEPGQRVRVTTGPLQGLIGTIERTSEKNRLLLSVEAFRMSVSVELDHEDVEETP